MQNQEQGFSFTGKGGEYFRIWIVNLFLTIITLGIYSAWAKVRRVQYFQRNTWLNGSSFDYHGTPIAILKGRLLAVSMFVAYNLALKTMPMVGLAIALLIAAVMPLLLVKSFRFRLYNTSYRGLRFGFIGSVKSAYMKFLLLPISGGVTAKTNVPELPEWLLRAVAALDRCLCWLAPSVFAMGRSLALEKLNPVTK